MHRSHRDMQHPIIKLGVSRMLFRKFLFMCLLALNLTTFANAQAVNSIPASERAVLLALYSTTNGSGWFNRARWGDPSGTECTWSGIRCLYGTQVYVGTVFQGYTFITVGGISLNQNNLIGTLPPLDGLTSLKDFSARNSQLTGSIPPLAGLTSLGYFDVYANQLTGSNPPLAGLTALQTFSVQSNQLTGSIPRRIQARSATLEWCEFSCAINTSCGVL